MNAHPQTSYTAAPGVVLPTNVAEFITSQVAEYFCITTKEMCSKNRKRVNVWPRQLAMSLIKKHSKLSLAAIGKQIADIGLEKTPFDHATVLHSVQNVSNITSINKYDKQTYDTLNNYVLNASNDTLQLVIREVSKSFGVAPVMVMDVDRKKQHEYKAVCAAVWLLQYVNKISSRKLAKYFSTTPNYITEALNDRVAFCNSEPAYYSKIMHIKKVVFGIHEANVESVKK